MGSGLGGGVRARGWAWVRVGGSERPQLAARLAVELHEDEVPHLEHVRVVLGGLGLGLGLGSAAGLGLGLGLGSASGLGLGLGVRGSGLG